jgi:hypothetical protein
MRPSTTFLNIGGLVAIGFDSTARYMLVVSHAGRGVYEVGSWLRVARDIELAYPVDGFAVGIGPIEAARLPVQEIDYSTGRLTTYTPDQRFKLDYESGMVEVTSTAAAGTDPNSRASEE